MENSEIQLRVAEARQRDVGRSIVRINNEIMSKLKVQTSNIIGIKGKRLTAAIAWPAYPEDEKKGIIRMDGRLRKNAGISVGELVKIHKANEKIAERLIISPTGDINVKSDSYMEQYIRRKLLQYPVTEGDILFITIGISSKKIPFKIIRTRPKGVVVIKAGTEFIIRKDMVEEDFRGTSIVTYEDVGGLNEQIKKIREMVELPLKHPELFRRLGITPPNGVLLRGPPGCGKTLLIRAVANESSSYFIPINGPEIMSKFYGESEKKLRGIFEEAENKSPSIIFIDELDAIAPKREEVTGEVERRVVAQLLALMDGLHGRRKVIIIGATNRPNALDPALRRPGRFDREIEIGVPNKEGRLEIIQIHTREMPVADDVNKKKLANITHGFVGADLAALCREAAMNALRRYLPELDLNKQEIPNEILGSLVVKSDDFFSALKEIQPSAIREVLIETPNISWSDIGGLEDVKRELREAIELPLKSPEAFTNIGIVPPKGILLYGPPGCGKTLLAKAVAKESESNFLSIKGPEVLSKWVGESEKAVREVFRKARTAAPAIVFFDEIDAITPRRGMSFGDSHVTSRVISQILTEIDGLETLKDVVVIAATNRPDIVDPALIRHGRIDRVIYVEPPDKDARRQIFKIYLKKMPLDDDFDLEKLVDMSEYFAGSDIQGCCQEAGLLALREDIKTKKVSFRHFEEAIKKIHPSCPQDVVDQYKRAQEYFRRTKLTGIGYS